MTSATAVKKLVTTLQMLIYYRTSNHNIDTVAPLPVAAEPRLPLPFGSGHVLPLPLTGPLGPRASTFLCRRYKQAQPDGPGLAQAREVTGPV